MTRLDIYLAKIQICPSRSIAKNLIREGHVSVNGNTCTKTSYLVRPSDVIKCFELFQDKTMGFWKLFQIEQQHPFLNKKMRILDLGSSIGGFLEYSALKCKEVLGIEISKNFFNKIKTLEEKYNNLKVINENIFELNHELLKNRKFDCILNDLTLDPLASMRALLVVLPYLGQKGIILFAVKLGSYVLDELELKLEQQFLYNKLIILKKLNIKEEKKEIHYILEKK